LNQAEADREASAAALADSEGKLGEAEAHLDETELAAIDFLAATMMIGTAAEDEIAVCMANALYEAGGPAILSQLAALTNEADPVTSDEVQLVLDMIRAAEGCGTTLDDLAMALDQTPTSPSAGPGQPAGQSVIEVVYAECAAGSGKACAALLMLADSGSEEETFALTCGGRFAIEDAPLLCIGVSDPT
jgi:hypothetical protein